MLISEMQEKQRKLDEYIAEKKNLGNPYDEKYYEGTKLALLVELGEFANATRIFKNWSNKGPEPKERILDELADIIHFWLKMMNFEQEKTGSEFLVYGINGGIENYSSSRTLIQLINLAFYDVSDEDWCDFYVRLIQICIKLGYTKSEVEAAYEKKYAENFRRQESGY